MKAQKIIILCLGIVVAGVLLAFSTWRQWNANQKTTLERMRPIPPIAVFPHGTSIISIAFSPKNPDHIVSAGEGNKVKVWNRNNTEMPETELIAHPPKQGGIPLSVNYIAFSPTGEWFASKCIMNLSFWNISSWKKTNSIEIPPGYLAISPKGAYLGAASNVVKLLDISDPNQVSRFLLPPRIGWESVLLEESSSSNSKSERSIIKYNNLLTKYHNASLTQRYIAIDISHDGKLIAAGGQMYDFTNEKWTHKIKIWDLHQRQLFKIIEIYPKKPKPKTENKARQSNNSFYSSEIRAIKFSPNNRFFAVGARNGLTIWSLPEWDIYHEIYDQYISDIAFSPDSKILAVAGFREITLWSVESMTPIALLKGTDFLDSARVIAFSPDGSTLAGGSFDGALWLWDVRELK